MINNNYLSHEEINKINNLWLVKKNSNHLQTHPLIYPYPDALGQVIFSILRWDFVDKDGNKQKKIRPLFKDQQQNWSIKRPNHLVVPYNLPEIITRKNDTILVVEGEKTAEAAKRLFPHWVITTSAFGANSANKTDWSYIKDRDVILCPDHDQAGIKYAERVSSLCYQAGAKSVKLLPIEKLTAKFLNINSQQLKKGYDLADALNEGLSAEQIASEFIEGVLENRYFLTEKDMVNFTLPDTVAMPTGFRINFNTGWVEFSSQQQYLNSGEEHYNEHWQKVCSYLVVTYKIRDHDSNNWSKVVNIIDGAGKSKQQIIPYSLITGKLDNLKMLLSNWGIEFDISSANLLRNYLNNSNPQHLALLVEKTGWCSDSTDLNRYVLSAERIYGNLHQDKEKIFFESAHNRTDYGVKGNLEDWQQSIGRLCQGNSRLQIAIMAALAAPIIEFMNIENFGIHLVGESSIGKTTALQVAASVWGKRINSWRTTDNALERMAKNANDGLLILDELSQINSDAAYEAIFMLGNGQGKARACKNGLAKTINTFRLIYLSSGEIGLADKIAQSKNIKYLQAGHGVRFNEIPADANCNLGIFENIHNYQNSKEFANSLKQMCQQYQGTVIDTWLALLGNDLKQPLAQITQLQEQWQQQTKHILKGADKQLSRVSHNLSLLAAVGQYAVEQQILPWNQEEAFNSCTKILLDLIKHRGGTESFELMQAMKKLLTFIDTHGYSRFKPIYHHHLSNTFNENINLEYKIHNMAGYQTKIANNGQIKYYFLPSIFQQEIVNSKIIIKQLIEKGIIIIPAAEKSSHGNLKTRYSKTIKVCKNETKRVIEINYEALDQALNLL